MINPEWSMRQEGDGAFIASRMVAGGGAFTRQDFEMFRYLERLEVAVRDKWRITETPEYHRFLKLEYGKLNATTS